MYGRVQLSLCWGEDEGALAVVTHKAFVLQILLNDDTSHGINNTHIGGRQSYTGSWCPPRWEGPVRGTHHNHHGNKFLHLASVCLGVRYRRLSKLLQSQPKCTS